jgi:hypothetical protein
MQKVTSIIVLFLLGMASVAVGQKTADYQVQPVALVSRWAKEVGPANSLKEYPRPQLVRGNWQNLNGLWDYAITVRDAARPTVFAGEILVPFPIESALSGVRKALLPEQHLWYRRSFVKPVLKAKERLMLNFGAVDWEATVFVNGREVGAHTGGYTAFSMDITDALQPGANELTVRVFDPTNAGIGTYGKQSLTPADIYYTASSGIWQTVWLEVVPTAHITGMKITPDIDKGQLRLSVDAPEGYTISATAVLKGQKLRSVTGNTNTVLRLLIPHARLWSPDDPVLYDLSVLLLKNGKVIDRVNSYFGMRKIAVQKDAAGVTRIYLNNKFTYNLGVLDQGFWPDGLYTAPTDEALAFDIKAIKAMGFNTIRKHIKVEPARWYYHADETGVLVWQDLVNPNPYAAQRGWPAFEKESAEILAQLHNYPCITTWVLFNEKWGQYDQERLTKWIKDTDPERIVNGHSGEYLYVNDKLRSPSPHAYIGADMTDVHSYPNPMMSERQADKAQVCGEFGGVGVSVPGHEWNDLKGWGYVEVKPAELESRYAGMVRQLAGLKEEGLSGSIYTQPFDVEGEENGLMTYDRDLIKIPVERLRAINGELISHASKGFRADPAFNLAKPIDINDNDDRYPAMAVEFDKGRKDSVFLRRLVLMAIRKKDAAGAARFGHAYMQGLKDLYSRQNLLFMDQTTRTSKDAGFEIYRSKAEQVNAVMGAYTAEAKVRHIIGKEEIEPYMDKPDASPDWDKIIKTITDKYGAFGQEKVYGSMMAFYAERTDWKNFGKYYALYYATAAPHSEYHINNISWTLFEHVSDTAVLAVAIRAAKYSMDHFAPNDPIDMDTYANLLYKAGDYEEALKWEEKAVRLSNNGQEFVDMLEKMKQKKPTWPE